MRNCFSNPKTWRSKKQTTAALRTLFNQLLHAFLVPLRSCASRVHFQALLRCVHRISRSLQFSFRSGVSTPTSPWSPLFLGWDHQFSGPHDGCGECGLHVVPTIVSRRVCPEVPSNRWGHLLSKLHYRIISVRWSKRPTRRRGLLNFLIIPAGATFPFGPTNVVPARQGRWSKWMPRGARVCALAASRLARTCACTRSRSPQRSWHTSCSPTRSSLKARSFTRCG